jgi:hypothetical protein
MSLLLHEPIGYPTTSSLFEGGYSFGGEHGEYGDYGDLRRPWFRRQRSGLEPRNKETVGIITTLLLIEHRARSNTDGNAPPPLPFELWEVILGRLVGDSLAGLSEVRTLSPGRPQVKVTDVWDEDGLLAPAECYPLAYWRAENTKVKFLPDWGVDDDDADRDWFGYIECDQCGCSRDNCGCDECSQDGCVFSIDKARLWACPECRAHCSVRSSKCEHCGEPPPTSVDAEVEARTAAAAVAAAPFTPVDSRLNELAEEWACEDCGEQGCSRMRCHMCGRTKRVRFDMYDSDDDCWEQMRREMYGSDNGLEYDPHDDYDHDYYDHEEPTGYYEGTPIYW